MLEDPGLERGYSGLKTPAVYFRTTIDNRENDRSYLPSEPPVVSGRGYPKPAISYSCDLPAENETIWAFQSPLIAL